MPLYISKETLAQIELVLLLCVLYILHRKKNTIQMKQIGITCWQMKDRRNRKWLGHHGTHDVMELAHWFVELTPTESHTWLWGCFCMVCMHGALLVYENKEKGELNIITRGCSRGRVELVGIWMCSWLIFHRHCVNRCSELCLRVKGQLLAPR